MRNTAIPHLNLYAFGEDCGSTVTSDNLILYGQRLPQALLVWVEGQRLCGDKHGPRTGGPVGSGKDGVALTWLAHVPHHGLLRSMAPFTGPYVRVVSRG